MCSRERLGVLARPNSSTLTGGSLVRTGPQVHASVVRVCATRGEYEALRRARQRGLHFLTLLKSRRPHRTCAVCTHVRARTSYVRAYAYSKSRVRVCTVLVLYERVRVKFNTAVPSCAQTLQTQLELERCRISAKARRQIPSRPRISLCTLKSEHMSGGMWWP